MIPRRMLALAALLFLAPLSARAGEEPSPGLALGEPAPQSAVKMKNVDGRELSIQDVAGTRGTLVIFSCNACPWVKAWERRIVELGNAYARRGVGMIAINSNDPSRNAEDGYETMKQRARQRGMRFAYVVDATSEVARAFGATRTPEAFLFDAHGRLVYHGTIDDNARQPEKVSQRYLRNALESLLAGRAIAIQETKSLGCTIKFRSSS